jgi:hypothetical protein
VEHIERLKIFLKTESLSVLERILSLLDRDPFSPTYGSFDKDFWAFRTKDFSNSAAQMSAWSLLLFSELSERDSIEELNTSQLIEYARAAFHYTWSLQNKDGSFDEWYPNERGWGGPTAYVLYTQVCSYIALKEKVGFTEEQVQFYLQKIEKTAHFLTLRQEVGALTNHFAISVAALRAVQSIAPHSRWSSAIEQIEEKILGFHRSADGSTLEYEGIDISYNWGTLAFLAKADRFAKSERLENLITSGLEFLEYFLFPDGTVSGTISSRHTEHFYPHAMLYWCKKNSQGKQLLSAVCTSEWFPLVARPQLQDDHYVHYLLWEYLEAYFINLDFFVPDKKSLPWQGDDFDRHFEQSGLIVIKKQARYIVLSPQRGGAFRVYDLVNKKCIYENAGVVIQLQSKRTFSSLWIGPGRKYQFLGNRIYITGPLYRVFDKRFSPFSLVLFRLFMGVCGSHSFTAHHLKGLIKKIMILRNSILPGASYEREILISESIVLTDILRIDDKLKKNILKVWFGGEFYTRYVPQSRYWLRGKNNITPQESSEAVLALKQQGHFTQKNEI